MAPLSRIFSFALILLLGASCSDSQQPSNQTGTRECSYNSDCQAPLICLYGQCMVQCKAQVDCPANHDCINNVCETASGSGGNTPSGSGGAKTTAGTGAGGAGTSGVGGQGVGGQGVGGQGVGGQAPSGCDNGSKDANETDVDCGGVCTPCPSGKSCGSPNDCDSNNCLQGVCQAASCSDSIQNGNESDTDCGGPACSSCANNSDCNGASDCQSGICTSGKCVSASCSDGIKNGDESDTDCGGSCALCDATKTCALGGDCQSGVCGGGVCQKATCNDGLKNGSESDVDCGSTCSPCGSGKSCALPNDCQSGVCSAQLCQANSCSDSTKNGSESDVDCGGSLCSACPDSATCNGPGDCISNVCTGNVCSSTFALLVTKNGTGSGTVTGSNTSISCGSSCSQSFASGTQVTLQATAAGGSSFTGWQGGGCSGTGACTVSMVQAQTVIATFTANQSGGHVWSIAYGSGTYDRLESVATAHDGAVAAVGRFTGTVDFGSGPLTSASQDDVLIMKRQSDGSPLWARRFGSSGNDYALTAAFDAQGDIFASGRMTSTFSLGGSVLSCSNASFFAKYSATNGAHVWSRCTGSNPVFRRAKVDSAGNVLFAGYTTSNNSDFGGGAIGGFGGGDAVLVKYNGTDGSYLWAKRYGSSAQDFAEGLALGAQNEIFLAGAFANTMNISGQGLVSVGGYDIFVTKLDASGQHIWSRGFGDSFADYAKDVAVDSQGDVVVVGEFRGTIDFGGGPLTSQGSSDIFVLKLKGSDGSFLWAQRFGGLDSDAGLHVECTGQNDIVVSGSMGSNVDFGSGALPNLGARDLFVARFNALGSVVHAQSFGANGNDDLTGLALSTTGGAIVSGGFQAPINFGGGTLPHVGSLDMFLVQLTP